MFGLSSTTAQETNQQVGAEGNSGPVFGAITIKGNKASTTKQTKAQKKAAKAAAASPASTPSAGDASAGDALSSGAGNLNISVVSSDVNADDNLASIAGESIVAQNNLATNSIAAQNNLAITSEGDNTNLAGYSIAAQNNLALATLGQAGQLASASLALASQSETQSNTSANNVAQAGENFAALSSGANPNALISPTGGVAAQNSNDWVWLAVLAVAALLILKPRAGVAAGLG
jgi:hypothetical protein